MLILKLGDTPDSSVIALAKETLKNGGLVVYPTETTYGIGADCENKAAVEKLISYKSKRDNKPLSVAVSDQAMAEKYVVLNQTARNLYKTFLPGPVTVISKRKGLTAPGVASGTETIGIRIPDFPFILKLIKTYGGGITATGANASYQKRPYTIQDIFDNTSEKQKALIDLVIDAGELLHREPSTVIDTTLDDVVVTRFGELNFKKNEQIDSQSVQETKEVASKLISRYRSKLTYAPLIFALTGEMGAGKTQFAKGIAAGLKISETITSPTFNLENEYHFTSEGRQGLLVHIDTWKMETAAQLEELMLQDLIQQKAVIVIEWADRFASEITKLAASHPLIWVNLKETAQQGRTITVSHP